MGKKIAIIGAGYTGLSAAKKLLNEGFEVTIYEKDKEPGGMTRTISVAGTEIEEYYRHIFKCDKYVIDLIDELELKHKLKWLKAKMGYHIKDKNYRFGQPLTLLTFKPLGLIQKIRFRYRSCKTKAYKRLEKIRKYYCRRMGHQKLWRNSI